MIQWKWSNGEPYERTPRYSLEKKHVPEFEYKEPVDNVPSEKNAYEQSLLSENDIWSIDGPQFIGNDNSWKLPNKRENTYNKMSEREMISQVNQNPFLANHNYLNDVMVHEKFLKPVSTTSEKERTIQE